MEHYRMPLIFPLFVVFALIDMYMDDRVLSDKEALHFSLNTVLQHREDNQTGFMLYSDRIRHLYPGYSLDGRNRVVPGLDTPTLNFDQVKETLLGKDLSRDSEFNWITKERDRFLDQSVSMREHGVGFCSYPRSGNTLLRVYLEQITGITTGSNVRTTGGALTLQVTGLKGEVHNCDDNDVWITKWHPYQSYGDVEFKTFTGSRMIYLVRNPIDMFVSEFLLWHVASHSKEINEEIKNHPAFIK